MKKLLITLLIAVAGFSLTHAQQHDSTTANDTAIYNMAQQMPEFKGGTDSLNKYFITHINYTGNHTGTVYVSFIVTQTGKITNAKILKGVAGTHDLDSIALRYINTMPDWIPGKQNGKTVNVRCILPVPFIKKVQPPTVQYKVIKGDTIYSSVEQMPQLTGGQSLYDYVNTHLEYPEEAQEEGISGIALIGFMVEPDGSVGDVEILHGISNGIALDEEAIKVISGTKWTPGKHKGKSVPVYFKFPVEFSPNNTYYNSKDSMYINLRHLHDTDKIYDTADRKPRPPSNIDSYMRSVFYSQIQHPTIQELRPGNTYGIIVSFIVEKDGTINDIKLLYKQAEDDLSFEPSSLGALTEMPKWKPAEIKHQPVRYRLAYLINATGYSAIQIRSLISLEISPLQSNRINDSSIYFSDFREPTLLNGDSISQYLNKQVIPITNKIAPGVQGIVELSFVVKKDGSIGNVITLESKTDTSLLDTEAVKLIRQMPKCKPLKVDGKIMNVQYTIIICFKKMGNDNSKLYISTPAPKTLIAKNGEDIYEYIGKNIEYPQLEKESGISGTVYVNFVVEKDGSVTNINILRGIKGGTNINKEVVRILSSMHCQPPTVEGIPLKIGYNIPIHFELR